MQYQLPGTDASGRLINEPTSQPPYSTASHIHVSNKNIKKGGVSSPWIRNDDGFISISLKNFTIFFALSISVALLAILYASCNDGTGEYVCTYEKFPMVSDVIN